MFPLSTTDHVDGLAQEPSAILEALTTMLRDDKHAHIEQEGQTIRFRVPLWPPRSPNTSAPGIRGVLTVESLGDSSRVTVRLDFGRIGALLAVASGLVAPLFLLPPRPFLAGAGALVFTAAAVFVLLALTAGSTFLGKINQRLHSPTT